MKKKKISKKKLIEIAETISFLILSFFAILNSSRFPLYSFGNFDKKDYSDLTLSDLSLGILISLVLIGAMIIIFLICKKQIEKAEAEEKSLNGK